MRKNNSLIEMIINNLLFLYIVLASFIVVFVYNMLPEEKPEPTTYNGFATEGELRAMRYLHKYHGTMFSEDGYFYRDGERCVLFDPRVRIDQCTK